MSGATSCFLRNKHGGGRRFKGGSWGFKLADGDSLTVEGSRAEQRYELNGKECRQRRKDLSDSPGDGGGRG